VEILQSDFLKVDQTVQEDGIFIHRLLDGGAQAPVVDQRLILVDTEYNIRVTYVDD
jgi:hypothetical protein